LAVDSSIKIKIIKEVRSILGLGLKEVIIYNIKAKELVEKAPTIIKKDLPKNLAEEMIEKFKAAGCNVNMI
jgi:large subunit ribosomal protein L7/L12